MRRLRLLAGGVAAMAALGAPHAASGAVTIGQSTGTLNTCGTTQSQLQVATAAGASYIAPISGVITSWKYRASGNPQPNVRIKAYAATGDPAVWFLRSHSPARTPTIANDVNPFTESPGIPIQAGDHLGLTGIGGINMTCFIGVNGDTTRTNGGGSADTTLGNNTMMFDNNFQRVAAEATIEPDADGDLFGDETQDQCPTDASTQGACSADVAITNVASPEPVNQGSDLTYTLAATNNNPAGSANNVVVTDPIPAGATFKSATSTQGNCAGTSTVGCNIGTLGPGGSATVEVVVTPTEAGVLSNTATVSSSTPDPNAANNSATATSTVNSSGNGGGGDTTAPDAQLSGKAKQDVDKLKVKARAGEAAAFTGQASVSVGGGKKVFKSKVASASAGANETVTLRLRFKKKALKAIKAAIHDRKKPKAKIRVTATDAAGNSSTEDKTVKLKD